MKIDRRTLRVSALLLGLGLAPIAALARAQSAAPQDPAQESAPAPAKEAARYVRVQPGGAKLMNLADKGADLVLQAPAGTMLAVRSERAGWLEVEPPSGLRVWVFGQYVRKTGAPGVAEITGNNVMMRPAPSSDVKVYPLAQRLGKGERVRVIARKDPAHKLSEDWVQVWSPPGTRAWVAASEVAPLAAATDARSAWMAAVKEAQAALPIVELTGAEETSASRTEGGVDAKPAAPRNPVVDLLEGAEDRMAAARASEKPDFGPAKAAYEGVIASAPKGASADTARSRLDEIEARVEIQRIKRDADAYEKKRQEELAKAEQRFRDASRKQDPLWGRFQGRGWLERDPRAGEEARTVVRWGGKEVAEIVCTSGRYDLADFVGHEIGVLGVTQRAAVPAAQGAPGVPARIDVSRIEVISGRAGGR